MKYALFAAMLIGSFVSKAQLPQLSSTGKNIQDFVPKGWTLIANIADDLNKDNLIDAAVVIQSGKQGSIDDYTCRHTYYPMMLFILLKQSDGSYKLSTASQKTFNRSDCMQFQELGKRNGTLKVTMADMSINGTSSEHQYFFRFQKNEWYLIGYTNEMAKNAGMDMGIWGTDMNLVTGVSEQYRLKIDPKSEIMDGPREVTKTIKSKPKPLLVLCKFDFDNNIFSDY